MNLPGFSASAALEGAGGHYRNTGYASSRRKGVQLAPQYLDPCRCPIWDSECLCTCYGGRYEWNQALRRYICVII
jgi:hypothetical protein